MRGKKNNMKKSKINKIVTAVGMCFFVLSFSSCLKNGDYFADFASAAASVDLPLAATNVNGPVTFAYDAAQANPSIPVFVNLASPAVLDKDVTATLAIDDAYLTKYNIDNGTSYTLLPSNAYTVSKFNITIKAGKRLDSATVKFDFSKFDFSKSYILPFTIASASQPIEQWNHLMLNIVVKNKFDAQYLCTGYVFHPSAPRANNAIYSIATAGGYACKIPFGDLGGGGNYFFIATVSTSSGVAPLTNYTPVGAAPASSGFMLQDNSGNVNYSSSAPNAPGTDPWLASTYNNTYDYSNQTFWVHVGYHGGGPSTDPETTYTRQFYLKFVRQ